MELEHKVFLKENYNNYETAKSGYVRDIDTDILRKYEHIYKTYVDASYVFTIWCGGCRMDLIKRLYAYYESLPIEETIIKKTKNKTNG